MKRTSLALPDAWIRQLENTVHPAEHWPLLESAIHHQYHYNQIYREYLQFLGVVPEAIQTKEAIPFLPIQVFKNRWVMVEGKATEMVFSSSGTTGTRAARHPVASLKLYRDLAQKAFARFLGDPSDYHHLALLPGYLERPGSSLIWMVKCFMEMAGDVPEQHFFKHDYSKFIHQVESLRHQNDKPLVLWGVSFALLDLADYARPRGFTLLPEETVIETGGMKGRRREWVRQELHQELKDAFDAVHIASEYGMTELLSQAYATSDGRFFPPPWMKVLVRDPTDPFHLLDYGETGGINVIDLANCYSCPFIATEDLGRCFPDGSFEVLGRFDHSEMRGCSLMMA